MPVEVAGLAIKGLCPLPSVFDMRVATRFYRDVRALTMTGRSPSLSGDPDHVNRCLLQSQGTQVTHRTHPDGYGLCFQWKA